MKSLSSVVVACLVAAPLVLRHAPSIEPVDALTRADLPSELANCRLASSAVGALAWQPQIAEGAQRIDTIYDCNGMKVSVMLAHFPVQGHGNEAVSELNRVVDEIELRYITHQEIDPEHSVTRFKLERPLSKSTLIMQWYSSGTYHTGSALAARIEDVAQRVCSGNLAGAFSTVASIDVAGADAQLLMVVNALKHWYESKTKASSSCFLSALHE